MLSEVYPFVSKTCGEMSVHYQGNGHYITVRVGGGGEEEGPRFNLSYPQRLCNILIIRLY